MINSLEGITKNILIVGVPKCGQNSLHKYLKAKYPNQDVTRSEYFWELKKSKKEIDEIYKDYQMVIILRDNVERIWSGYRFYCHTDLSIDEYLKFTNGEDWGHLQINPVEQGDYKYWINLWKEYNPIIVWLEDCIKLEGFPHENITKDNREDYKDITEADRQIIKENLNYD